MALSSSEIAAMNGAYQQQAMNNQAYAGMIGQGPVYGGRQTEGYYGERIGGSVLTKAGSVGMPLAGLAAGLAGIDPLSVGLRVGMGAYATGGIAGGLAAGAIAAAPVMAAGAVISYGVGQMMQGAHEQTQLNATLRNSFTFRNAMGGQGFTRADMSSVGTMVREMSEHFGPGGEIASFKELTSLAGKMGTMGFAQGVRDVKEFSSRFKEMVKTLKTMATELGTTLDGAMEFAAAAKGSGIFGTKNIRSFAHDASAAAKITNGALSQFTGAANIGSQISRSIGGLGRQGAAAGIRTMTQIRMAREAGVLSEEDIYNQTGLTGAEGEQAMMASELESSSNFLRTTKGRRLMASMANGNGQLDESVVQQYLSGSMSVGDTRREKERHLKGGMRSRANFIRNEGRYRGAVLERMGGTVNAIALKQWVEQKGIDFEDPDQRDRAMLFAQRTLGLGRDQADNLIKQVENGSFLQSLQHEKEISQSFVDSEATRNKQRGIEGLKNRWEQTKERMGSGFKKFGSAVSESLDNWIDSTINGMLQHYTEVYSKNMDENIALLRRGGVEGARTGRNIFGFGTGGAKQFAADLTGGKTLALGRSISDMDMFHGSTGAFGAGKSAFAGETVWGQLSDVAQNLKFGQAGAMQLADQGVHFSADIWKNRDVAGAEAHIGLLDQQRLASGVYSKEFYDRAKNFQGGDWLNRAYGVGLVHGSNDERLESFEKLITERAKGEGKDAADAQEMVAQWHRLNPKDRAKFMGNVEAARNINEALRLQNNMEISDETRTTLGKRTGWATEKDANEAWAGAMGFKAMGMSEEQDAQKQAAGAYFRSDKYITLAQSLFAKRRQGETEEPGTEALNEELQRLQADKGLDTVTRDVLLTETKKLGAAGELTQRIAANGGKDLKPEEMDRILNENGLGGSTNADMAQWGITPEEFRAAKGSDGASWWRKEESYSRGVEYHDVAEKDMTDEQRKSCDETALRLKSQKLSERTGLSMEAVLAAQEANRAELAKRTKESARTDIKSLAAVGLDVGAGLTVDVSKMAKGDQEKAQKYMKLYGEILQEESATGETERTSAKRDELRELTRGISTAGLRQMGAAMGGQGTAGELAEQAGIRTRFGTLSQRYGQTGAAARMLGADMTDEELKGATASKKEGGGLTKAGAGLMLQKAGISGDIAAGFIGKMAGKKGDDLAAVLGEVMEAQRRKQQEDKDKEKAEDGKYKSAMQSLATKQMGFLEQIARHTKGVDSKTIDAIADNPVVNDEGHVSVQHKKKGGV